MDARLIAVQVGDALKYDTSINEIDRIGGAVLKIKRDSFPNDAITSVRAQHIHDWVLSLANTQLDSSDRNAMLIKFCRGISGDK